MKAILLWRFTAEIAESAEKTIGDISALSAVSAVIRVLLLTPRYGVRPLRRSAFAQVA
jgi:hypothetical protein